MAVLESCPKHNMVAYLEKTDGNTKFHEIIKLSYAKLHLTTMLSLVQPTEDEGDTLERQSEPQPIPSPPHLKGSGGNHGGQFSIYRSLSWNEGGMTLQSVYDFCISLCTQLDDDTMTKETRILKKWEDKLLVHEEKEMKSATQHVPTTTTPTIFGDDETIAQVLIIMSQNKEKLKEKEKGVELKDVEETERPRPTLTRSLLTLKPLPKIDPKDKGKKMIEEEDESNTNSEDITKAKKKFKQLARDEEVARKARLNADKILAEKLQEEEQKRNVHVGGKKHSDLKTKGFEEIKALYDKIKGLIEVSLHWIC
ncbi:hypothetical protein Tco_0014552 [Tanacetum coccineum]